MTNIVSLQKGGNTILAESGTITVELRWSSTSILDVSSFLVGANGKVPSDAYMVFYNQETEPERSVWLTTNETNKVVFTIQLEKLSPTIQHCFFTATLEGNATFATVQGLSITVKSSQGEVCYQIDDATEERALVLAEVYRHQATFKFRAIGRGFNGGLKPLAESYGVEVEEPEVPSISSSEPVQEVHLTKIDLLKKKVSISLEKKKIAFEKSRIAVVFDASGSMTRLYQNGTVQRAFERVLAVAACMDDNGELDVWFFGSKFMKTRSVTERDFEDYIQQTYPVPKMFGGLGSGNNEPPVMKDIIRHYVKKEPRKDIPAYIIFFSDGGIYKDKEIAKILIDASQHNIFWQFVGLGNANYGVLQKLDDLPGRFIDNADFFALDDLDKITDEELYDRLLNEFPQWLRKARAKGILH
ncbi:VWA domain-containing protein [Lysinibacillus macroides]|uniref:Tellurium resistance protein TerF n=1 Tax=Lysinibacillus macroides TaxID=33935 RepID=A0A0N1J007_9BACI|nr:VWA domain-containing protein [Lysinibacillus macroides]KOY80034.1 tellurium resistance protein TerF [Lysinibacillus macroides]QPR67322.1 VWA domain-containing protein [Lysinibacillus macroides]